MAFVVNPLSEATTCKEGRLGWGGAEGAEGKHPLALLRKAIWIYGSLGPAGSQIVK